MKILCIILVLIVALSGVSCVLYEIIHEVTFETMVYLPEGKFLSTHDSPTNEYTVNIYLVDGGATVAYAIRGELVNNEDGSKKNIYWKYREHRAHVVWIDEETVKINEHTLNIFTDVYDWRSDTNP